jgi:predicted transcriptional regulator of viral defense system
MLDTPMLGGGIRHVGDIVSAYFGSEHRDETRLVQYAERLGNRTVFKRLGFLIERFGIEAPRLLEQCRQRLSRGLSSLDPDVRERGKIVKRWNLRINVGQLASRHG